MKLTEGPYAVSLEQEFGSFLTSHGDALPLQSTVACSSGTTALFGAFVGCGIGPGDEVVVPGYGFQAAALAVLMVGAQPVFADVDPVWGLIDPDTVPVDDPKAIVAIDLDGRVANYERINELFPDAWIVEDAAPSLGSAGLCSEYVDVAIFSGNESKKWSCGEGGMISTPSRDIAHVARAAMRFGETDYKPAGGYRTSNVRGMNGKIPELCAMTGLADLPFVRGRSIEADRSRSIISIELGLPEVPSGSTVAWHKIRLPIGLRDRWAGPTTPTTVAPLEDHPLFSDYVTRPLVGARQFHESTFVIGDRTHTPWSGTLPGFLKGK